MTAVPLTVKRRRAHTRMLSEIATVLLMRCDTGRYRAGQHLPTAADLAAQLAVPVAEVTTARTQLSGYGVLTEGVVGDGYTVTPRDQWAIERPAFSRSARRAASLLRTGIRTGRYQAGTVLMDELHLWDVLGIRTSHRREARRILACEGLITLPADGAPSVVRALASTDPAVLDEGTDRPTLFEGALVAMLVRGATNEEMLTQLQISRSTLHHHLGRIGSHFAAVSRANRVHAVLSGGWTTPPPAHGQAPAFDANDLLLLRALAEQPDRMAIADVMVRAVDTRKALTAWIREVTLRAGARSEDHLVALGHTWGLLGPSVRPGDSRAGKRVVAATDRGRA